MSSPPINCPNCSATLETVRVGSLAVGWCKACAPEGFTPPQGLLDAIAESPAALREALEADAQESRDAGLSEPPDITKFVRWGEDTDVH